MSRKGVSAEEKKSRLIQLFYERGECFQLKELEKIASKEKGIVVNSVKEVLQTLVDDGLVDTDKIGGSIYYWAFPSKILKVKKRKCQELQNKLDESTKKLKLIEQTVEESKSDEDKKHKQNKVLDELNDLELALYESKQKLKQFRSNDPQRRTALTNKTTEVKDAANRWTDNIFAVKMWCKKKFFIEENVLNKEFGIPEEFDYVN